MNNKRLIGLFFLVNVFLLGLTTADACSCVRMNACEAFSRAKIVFSGRIIKAVENQGTVKHQVQVEETFLGLDNSPLVDVVTSINSSCGFEMTEGETYLIFAWRKELTGEIVTGMCSNTKPIGDAEQDLAYLRAVKNSGKSGGNIEGLVYDAESSESEPRKPDQIDKVLIESPNGEKFEADIKADGKYSLLGLTAGKYRVFLDLPKGFITVDDTNPYDEDSENPGFVEVPERGCVVKNFDVKIDGVISGRLIDANGLPVAEREVNLLRLPVAGKVKIKPEIPDENTEPETEKIEPEAEKYEAKYEAYTDENGGFIFKGLPPGRYLLGFGIDDFFRLNEEGDHYLPTYFPSSKKQETAVIIDLKRAEVVTDRNIQLFPKLKKRKITGQIIWKNGRVEPKARAEFYGGRDGFSRADWGGWLTIDAKGNFTFEGYEETEYLVRAWLEKPIGENNGETYSEITNSSKCFIIPKKGSVKPIKLILEAGGSNCDVTEFRDK